MSDTLQAALASINSIILGKQSVIEDAVCAMLAGGHLLVEDVPGVGKTTLTTALAKVFGLRFTRVQFTSDLLPTDLTGLSVFDRNKGEFVYRPGPIFTQVLLADEINRASPKTQSALLEAMEERQVSVEGATRKLDEPFFVMATQNPTEQVGTHPLPESQLDRFLMCVSIGFPDHDSERALLNGVDRRDLIHSLPESMQPPQLLALQTEVRELKAAPALLDYVQAIMRESRSGKWFSEGLSPRAGIGLLRAAKARALLSARRHVLPDDVQRVVGGVIAHRLRGVQQGGLSTLAKRQIVSRMLEAIPI